MIDTAQLAGCHEDKGVVLIGNVVYGEIFSGQGNHQSAGSFHEYGVVAAGKLLRGVLYFVEVDRTVVDACRKMGRAGIGEDFGHCKPLVILRQIAGAHDAAVQVDVLGVSGIAGLNEFLGDDTLPVPG